MFSLVKQSNVKRLKEFEHNRELSKPVNVPDNSFDILVPYLRSHSHPEECTQHRRSEVIEFTNTRRKIQRGCCLGHSQKGCITFSGIDLETGQLLYITEWLIKYSHLEAKCAASCKHGNSATSCSEHGVDEVIANIENQMIDLERLRHNNLVHYECVRCVKKTNGILVHLAQDFVLGNSVGNLSTSFGWSEQSVSLVAKSVLDALIFLHSNSITHGLLYDTAVYIDNCSIIRVTDFALVSYLQDLIGVQRIMKNDLEALGVLVESLLPTPSSITRDFINRCTSQSELLRSADLLDDPFLQPELRNEANPIGELNINTLEVPTPKFTEIGIAGTTGSRFHSDYKNIAFLGVGSFGNVYKARNNLDNREYAIKRLRLPAKSQKLYDTMTREVKVLSRLNHENVVRYYSSWIETAPLDKYGEKRKLQSNDWSSSIDCLEFVNSSSDKNEEDDLIPEDMDGKETILQYMYIQMEYCDGSTLRTVIDNHLYVEVDRLWRLFREIIEGLAHIHQQSMIHRDLKPANIFIGSRDRIKIGDFGLATTCRLDSENKEQPKLKSSIEIDTALTGEIGTALYTAPELLRNVSDYNQKVDLYSLGVILFEMSCPPFKTGMERVSVLSGLRTMSIEMPEIFLSDPTYTRNVTVIRKLLDHNWNNRPTTDELLKSELLPTLETSEFHDMIRNTIAQPQSNQYKNIVARFLDQKSESGLDLSYNHSLVHQNAIDYVKSKVLNLFRKHGAIEIVTPLLTPCTENCIIEPNAVRLMTNSGNNVILPFDLRLPFARHIVINGINMIRRYSIERVYREATAFNFHPIQFHECAFDIVTPRPGNLLVDAELILIANDIIKELPSLRQINISIRINHTTLLRAILLYFNVPYSKLDVVAINLLDYNDGKMVESQIIQILHDAVLNHKKATLLFNVLTTEYPFDGAKFTIAGSNLQTLIKRRSSAASLAKGAIRDIESVVRLARGLGVNCPIILLPGLPVGYDRTKAGGIVWQMLAEYRFGSLCRRYLLAAGERYDSFLSEFQKSKQLDEMEISGAGFSFSLESLMHAYATSAAGRVGDLDWNPVHVLVCVLGTSPPFKDVTDILKSLWTTGICSGSVEAASLKDACEIGRKLGARYLVVMNENGGLTFSMFENQNIPVFCPITRTSLINTIINKMEADEHNFRVIHNNLKKRIRSLRQGKIQLAKKLKKIRRTDHISQPTRDSQDYGILQFNYEQR